MRDLRFARWLGERGLLPYMRWVVLTALPILAFAGLFISNPSFYLDVSDDPAFVPGFLGLITLYLIGFFSIRRMVDLKV